MGDLEGLEDLEDDDEYHEIDTDDTRKNFPFGYRGLVQNEQSKRLHPVLAPYGPLCARADADTINMGHVRTGQLVDKLPNYPFGEYLPPFHTSASTGTATMTALPALEFDQKFYTWVGPLPPAFYGEEKRPKFSEKNTTNDGSWILIAKRMIDVLATINQSSPSAAGVEAAEAVGVAGVAETVTTAVASILEKLNGSVNTFYRMQLHLNRTEDQLSSDAGKQAWEVLKGEWNEYTSGLSIDAHLPCFEYTAVSDDGLTSTSTRLKVDVKVTDDEAAMAAARNEAENALTMQERVKNMRGGFFLSQVCDFFLLYVFVFFMRVCVCTGAVSVERPLQVDVRLSVGFAIQINLSSPPR